MRCRNFKNLFLVLGGLMLSQIGLSAAKRADRVDLRFGVDFSYKSFNGDYGKFYGNSLHKAEGAFQHPERGEELTPPIENRVWSPMAYAVKLVTTIATKLDDDANVQLCGVEDKDCHLQRKVFSISSRLAARPMRQAPQYNGPDGYAQAVTDTALAIERDRSWGDDFNPLPYMEMMLKASLSKNQAKQMLVIIFTQGDIENTKRDDLTRFLIKASQLSPIRFVFYVVNPNEGAARELSDCIHASKKERRFMNATVIKFNYFDIDSAFREYPRLDLKDTMENKFPKILPDLFNFLREDAATMESMLEAEELAAQVRSTEYAAP